MILVGCEESQVVTNAFRRRGYAAWSCDVEETRGNPAYHIRDDVMNVIPTRRWDLIILHPDCTYMSVSGNRWYAGTQLRQDSIDWTVKLWSLAKDYSSRVALENPVSVIFKHIGKAHYVQPYQFGHGETKKTGFVLHNLPELVPTNEVKGREQRVWKMAPSNTRKRDRSRTYDGIAEAMADQWGAVL